MSKKSNCPTQNFYMTSNKFSLFCYCLAIKLDKQFFVNTPFIFYFKVNCTHFCVTVSYIFISMKIGTFLLSYYNVFVFIQKNLFRKNTLIWIYFTIFFRLIRYKCVDICYSGKNRYSCIKFQVYIFMNAQCCPQFDCIWINQHIIDL